jgi:hypothetical protein
MAGLNNRLNTTSTGPDELWEWLDIFLRKTGKTILNTLAAWWEFTAAWFSKFLEKYWNQDPNVITSRQSLVQHHLNQGKNRMKNAKEWVIDAGKWARKAAKWAGKIVVQVGSHVIDWLKK